MKAPILAILLVLPAVVVAQGPTSAQDNGGDPAQPVQCSKTPENPDCPADTDAEPITDGLTISPRGGCHPVRPGCSNNVLIEKCDSCSVSAMKNLALAAATLEGDNHVYVVDRPSRQVRHYLVLVEFTPDGVHKTANLIGFQSPRARDMKALLEAAAGVNNMLAGDRPESDDESSSDPSDPSSLDWAICDAVSLLTPPGPPELNEAIEKYINAQAVSQAFFNVLADVKASFSHTVLADVGDVATDSSIIFEWSNGGSMEFDISLALAPGGGCFDAMADRSSVKSAGGEYIPATLAGLGVGSEGGKTEPFDIGDPSNADDFLDYVNRLATEAGCSALDPQDMHCDETNQCVVLIHC